MKEQSGQCPALVSRKQSEVTATPSKVNQKSTCPRSPLSMVAEALHLATGTPDTGFGRRLLGLGGLRSNQSESGEITQSQLQLVKASRLPGIVAALPLSCCSKSLFSAWLINVDDLLFPVDITGRNKVQLGGMFEEVIPIIALSLTPS